MVDLIGESNKKRFHIDAIIDSHLSKQELKDELEALGFCHFTVEVI